MSPQTYIKQYNRNSSNNTTTGDPHLNLVLCILHGIRAHERERWMRINCPRTLAMLGVSQLIEEALN